MRLSHFLDGLNILRKYFDNPDGFHFGAEHDIVYVYPTDRPVEAAELEKLVELGWLQEEALPDDGGDFAPVNYDPAESWAAYT